MILGCNLNHDYALCIVSDDKIYLKEQERFSRIRYHWEKDSYTLAILDDITIDDLSEVKCICINSPQIPFISEEKKGNLSSDKRSYKYEGGYPTIDNYFAEGFVEVEDKIKIPAIWISHYAAHAYSAYYTSGYNNSDVICYDGGGDFGYGAIFKAKNKSLTPIKVLNQEFGYDYNYFGHMIFQPEKWPSFGFFESKVMAMAAYGDAEVNGIRDFLNNMSLFKKPYEKTKVTINEIALFQRNFEDAIFEIISSIENKSKNLCCAGGCFYNILLNSKIAKSDLYDSIYIPPYPGDMGTAIGCALYAYIELGNNLDQIENLNSPYLGNELNPTMSDIVKGIKLLGDQPVSPNVIKAILNVI